MSAVGAVGRGESDTASVLTELATLYEAGRYEAALARGRALGALHEWPTTPGQIWAGRIAARLGAPRLSSALFRRAWWRDPLHPSAVFYYGAVLLNRRGPWHALRWLRRAGTRSERTADLVGSEARALAMLRDFERAHALLAEARELAPSSPWVLVERAGVLEHEDRFEEALASTEEALALRPGYRPALHQRAHLMTALGRWEEALAQLAEVTTAGYELLWQRSELRRALRQWPAVVEDVRAARSAASLAEKHLLRAFASREAEGLYLLGRYSAAAPRAREAASAFDTRFADELARLAEGAPLPRVELAEVPHIRQHHVTCAPASIAQITAFHGDPVDHLELAATICYAGTPRHLQRTWAEERGYVVREFDLDFESARRAIDARFPFILTTASASAAHAQAVIGYDRARRTLLVRDPSIPSLVEMPIDQLVASQKWQGPHAMLLVPRAHAASFGDAGLTSASLYDLRHRIAVALERHDLADAEIAAQQIAQNAPESRHALEARSAIAAYRGDGAEELTCLQKLLALHPRTAGFVVRIGALMHGRRPRSERLAFWEAHADVPDPAVLEAHAEDLRHDGSRQEEAARLLRQALRILPGSGMAHHIYADLVASGGGSEQEALESYRFAVCVSPMDEHMARAYFDFAQRCGRPEEALALLERRVTDASDRASGPARTLFAVHADRGNPERGLEVLQRTFERRPDDGELAATIVTACLEAGDVLGARQWLDRTAGVPTKVVERAIAEARVAEAEGRLADARDALARAAASAPERIDVLARWASVVHDLEGRPAAVAVLEAAHARAPGDGAVLRQLCVWLRGREDARARTLLEERLRDHPDDQWSGRELALVLSRLGAHDAAVAEARRALENLPHDSIASSVLGVVLDDAGEHEAARAALRRAVELDVDNVSAIRELANRHETPEQRRVDARFCLDQLDGRISFGGGLLEALHFASCLPLDERTQRFHALLRRSPHRPDYWEAVGRAQLESGDLAAAEETCASAVEKFPRWFALRLLQADIRRARGDSAGEAQTLRDLCAAAPLLEAARAALSEVVLERGDAAEALAIANEGLARLPKSVALRRARARAQWAAGEREQAFAAIFTLAREHIGDGETFEQLHLWARMLHRAADVERWLREEQTAHPQDPVPPFRLARTLADPARLDERIAALRETVARAPRHAPALDLLAEALAASGRHEEALDVSPPGDWKGPIPVTMRGRAAWIRWQGGDVEAGIAAMRSVLADDPGYAWGRRQLCDWLDAAGRYGEFELEAKQLVAEAPTVADSYVYLGDAKQRTGDRAGALDAYDRAVALAPTNVYPALQAVLLLLGDGHVDQARVRIDRVRRSLRPYEVALLEIETSLIGEDADAALRALETLLDDDAPQSVIRHALDAFTAAGYLRHALRRVEERFAGEGVARSAEAIAYAWSGARESAQRSAGALSLFSLGERLSAAGRLAAGAWLEVLARRGARFTLFWVWLRHRKFLRRTLETWGSFGFALYHLGFFGLCARWLGDWREHRNAPPWMLLNLVSALWIAGRGRDAGAVAAHACTLPRDHASERHLAYRALEMALAGDADAAAEVAEAVGRAEPTAAALRELVLLLRDARQLGSDATADEILFVVGSALARVHSAALDDQAVARARDATVESILSGRPPHVRDAVLARVG